MKDVGLLVTALLIMGLMVAGIAWAFSLASAPKQVTLAQLTNQARHVKGAGPTPKIVITEFSDFQCPGCRQSQPILAELLKKYPNDIQLNYRHFPIPSHSLARFAAQAAEAAGQFDKFWQMYDLLFATQDEWSELGDKTAFQDWLVKKLAEPQLMVDKTQFLAKMNSTDIDQGIAADIKLGQEVGISATPTFYVNTTKVSAPELTQVVESLLNQK